MMIGISPLSDGSFDVCPGTDSLTSQRTLLEWAAAATGPAEREPVTGEMVVFMGH